jgi:hypothetical protein
LFKGRKPSLILLLVVVVGGVGVVVVVGVLPVVVGVAARNLMVTGADWSSA